MPKAATKKTAKKSPKTAASFAAAAPRETPEAPAAPSPPKEGKLEPPARAVETPEPAEARPAAGAPARSA